MRKDLILLLISFASLGMGSQLAQATDDTVFISLEPVDRSMKPKSPSRQSIYCYYDGSSLYFSFAYSEGDCDLTVSSASGIQSYTFSTDEPETVCIGAVSSASITLYTEAGNTYVGEIE